jgi:hypothetical protein
MENLGYHLINDNASIRKLDKYNFSMNNGKGKLLKVELNDTVVYSLYPTSVLFPKPKRTTDHSRGTDSMKNEDIAKTQCSDH